MKYSVLGAQAPEHERFLGAEIDAIRRQREIVLAGAGSAQIGEHGLAGLALPGAAFVTELAQALAILEGGRRPSGRPMAA